MYLIWVVRDESGGLKRKKVVRDEGWAVTAIALNSDLDKGKVKLYYELKRSLRSY